VTDQTTLEAIIGGALLDWCDAREDPDGTAARMVRSWHMDIRRSVAARLLERGGRLTPIHPRHDNDHDSKEPDHSQSPG
jgi:hypothetical protein